MAGSVLASGCAVVPDWASPVAWVARMFSDEPAPIETSAGGVAEQLGPRREQAEDRPYPSLSTVPERPAEVTSPQERERIIEGLIADRANARYTDPVGPGAEQAPASPADGALPNDRSSSLLPDRSENGDRRRPSVRTDASPFSTPRPAWTPGVKLAALSPGMAPAGHGATAKSAPDGARPVPPPVAPQHAAPPVPGDRPTVRAAAPVAPERVIWRPGAGTLVISAEGKRLAAPGEFAVASTGQPAAVLHFAHGSARVDEEGRAVLLALARQARADGAMVRVVGHSSQRTDDMPYAEHKLANFRMSLKRAGAVARQLRDYGIGRDALIVEAVGDSQPVYYEIMPAGEAENRRAEVYLVQPARTMARNRS